MASYEFPSSWRASIKHYWQNNKTAAAQAEDSLVRRGLEHDGIPLIEEPNAASVVLPKAGRVIFTHECSSTQGKYAVFKDLPLDAYAQDKRQYLHYLEIGEATPQPNEHPIVVTHGFGNGLGFLWQNMGAFSSLPNSRTIFLDWLGMGRSGRPTWPTIKQRENTYSAMTERVTQAETFFVDSLEEFRQKKKIEKMTLVGHSIGGYLSTAYALKYPNRVNRLILISPAGIPKAPYKSNYKPEPHAGDLAEELIPSDSLSHDRDLPEMPKTWWARLWEAGTVSPFSILRGMTFYAPAFLSRYAKRRFSSFEPEVQKDLFSYLFAISMAPASGEYCFSHFLTPGAYGRWPLINRMGKLDHPVTFIYGDNDWMDSGAGVAAVKMLKEKPNTPGSALQKKESKVLINSNAGHWVFLENVAGFNTMITKELVEADRQFRAATKASDS